MPRGSSSTIRRGLATATDALLSVLLAPACVACGRALEAPLAGAVCGSCWSAIRSLPPPVCRTCGDALPSWRSLDIGLTQCARCRRGAWAIAAGRAAGEYDGALREVLHAFKYEGRRSLAAPLGRRMRQAGADVLRGADAAVPVPLHPWRRLRRGFNQATDLARCLELPVVPALWRVRPTAPQAGLSAAARRRNVRDAFRLSPLLSRSCRRLVAGGVIVVIDDVRTTGATLNACAQVLLDAGAREVRALTAARAALDVRTRRSAPGSGDRDRA